MNSAGKQPIVAFFGHHKCATTWMAHFIDYVCRLTGRRTESLDNPRQYGGDLEAYRRTQGIDFLFMRNARWSEVNEVPFVRAVHLIRDPRDILVSAYFSHRNSHPTEGWPELTAHRARLRETNIETGLLLELDFSASVFDDIASWNYGDDRVLELKFERLIQDPYQTVLSAFNHLGVLTEEEPSTFSWARIHGLDLLARWLRRISGRVPMPSYRLEQVPAEWFLVELHRNRFARLAEGRAPGEENTLSHFRKGVAGDWKVHFTPKVEAVFNERYGELLESLAYPKHGWMKNETLRRENYQGG